MQTQVVVDRQSVAELKAQERALKEQLSKVRSLLAVADGSIPHWWGPLHDRLRTLIGGDASGVWGFTNYFDSHVLSTVVHLGNTKSLSIEALDECEAVHKAYVEATKPDGGSYFIANSGTYKSKKSPEEMTAIFAKLRSFIVGERGDVDPIL